MKPAAPVTRMRIQSVPVWASRSARRLDDDGSLAAAGRVVDAATGTTGFSSGYSRKPTAAMTTLPSMIRGGGPGMLHRIASVGGRTGTGSAGEWGCGYG